MIRLVTCTTGETENNDRIIELFSLEETFFSDIIARDVIIGELGFGSALPIERVENVEPTPLVGLARRQCISTLGLQDHE